LRRSLPTRCQPQASSRSCRCGRSCARGSARERRAQETLALEGTELADTSPDVTDVADQLVVGFEESATKAEVSEAVAGVEGTVTESLPALDTRASLAG
jgi:Fervidolysin N-terminal prodomain